MIFKSLARRAAQSAALFFFLTSLPASADMPGQVSLRSSAGKERFRASELSGQLWISDEWALSTILSSSTQQGEVLQKEISIGTDYRPNERHKAGLQLSSGNLYGLVTTNSSALNYAYTNDWIFTELETQLALTVETTTYQRNGVQVSPRENSSAFRIGQEVSESVSLGLTSSRVYRTEESVREFNRFNRNLDDPSLYTAGPMEESSGLLIDWEVADSDNLGFEFSRTRYADGGASRSSSISWDHAWTSWALSFEIATSREEPAADVPAKDPSSLFTAGLTYMF